MVGSEWHAASSLSDNSPSPCQLTIILLHAFLYSFFADGFLIKLTLQETKEDIDKMSNDASLLLT